jgi:hypothetical protein
MASVHTSSTPLSAELVLGKTPSLKEPRLLGGVLYWLEQRPQEQGRTTLMARRSSDQDPQELTPGSWNLRCRVHEYGGGGCASPLRESRQRQRSPSCTNTATGSPLLRRPIAQAPPPYSCTRQRRFHDPGVNSCGS